jgi:acetyl-CoA carboxylase carboxyltransferase component
MELPRSTGLCHVVPESCLRSYNMRTVLETLADDDSMREIREVLVTA